MRGRPAMHGGSLTVLPQGVKLTALTIVRGSLHIRLPWPPSANAYWRPVPLPNGQVIMSLTKRARMYCSQVSVALRLKLGAAKLEPYLAPVRIEVELRAPDKRTRDLDNHLRGIFNAFTKCGVWKDDSLVDELICRRGLNISGGCADVIVTPLDPQP